MDILHSPLTADLKADIFKEFAESSLESMGFDGLAEDPAAFKIIKNGLRLGVCVVQLFWGNLHIKSLLVHKHYRRKGIGRQLLEHALTYGKEQGCDFAFVETLSFQAPEFYKKLGFEVELKREGYAAGTSFYYLRKDL